MNKSLSIFLLSDEARMIEVAYELDDKGNAKDGKLYKFKTFDKTIAPKDLVIVPTGTRAGFTVVKVFNVDVEVDFDGFDSGIEYKWIAGKFDPTSYDEGVAKEKHILDAIAAAEKQKKREELKETLLKHVPPDAQKALLAAPTAIPTAGE